MTKTATKQEQKAIIIERLMAQASLDFRCCGHGGNSSQKK